MNGRFQFVSATQCRLVPYNDNRITIAGQRVVIPDAGVNLSNAGLSGNTVYYVYAYLAGATVTLEGSTTGHVAGPAGFEIKSGDPSRTLVGMVRIHGEGTFDDTGQYRFVLSWMNRRRKWAASPWGQRTTGTINTYVPITGCRLWLLTWGDEAVDMAVTSQAYPPSAIGNLHVAIGIDGGGASGSTFGNMFTSAWQTQTTDFSLFLSEGQHYLDALGGCSTSVAEFYEGTMVTAMIYG